MEARRSIEKKTRTDGLETRPTLKLAQQKTEAPKTGASARFLSARVEQGDGAGRRSFIRLAAEAHLTETEGLPLVAASSRGRRGFLAASRGSFFNRAGAAVAAAVAAAAIAVAVATMTAVAAVATVTSMAAAVAAAAAVAGLGRVGVASHQSDADDRQKGHDAQEQSTIHSSTSRLKTLRSEKSNDAAVLAAVQRDPGFTVWLDDMTPPDVLVPSLPATPLKKAEN